MSVSWISTECEDLQFQLLRTKVARVSSPLTDRGTGPPTRHLAPVAQGLEHPASYKKNAPPHVLASKHQ